MAINSRNGNTLLETGFFPPCRAATTGANITLSGLQVLDGVTLIAGDRVLVKDQTDSKTNGLYSAGTGNWVRTSDAASNSQFFDGMCVVVSRGTANIARPFICTCTDDPVIIGTSLLTFAAVSDLQPFGNVVGPAAAVRGQPALFAGTTGKILEAGGVTQLNVKDPQWGAKGDGSTNDTTAVQNAINSLAGSNGGVVFFPAGTYKLSSGITVSTGCRLVGAGQQNTILWCGGADVTVVTLNANGATLEHCLVEGKGAAGDSFSATQPAIATGSLWVGGLIFDVEAIFGSAPLKIGGSDSLLLDVIASNGYGLLCQNDSPSGCWFIRCKFDQSWPTGTAPSGMASAVPARADTTAYVANQIVSSGGFVLQCKTGGTTGTGAPTLRNYFLDMTDGTVTWRLASPVNYTGMTITGVGSQHALTMCDFTGCYNIGLLVSGAVTALQINQCTFGQQLTAGISTNAAGSSMTISDNTIFGGLFTSTGAGISIGATWSQSCIIRGNKIDGATFSSKWGVNIGGGVLTIISDNIFNGGAQAIEVAAAVTDFVISGNVISSTASIKVGAGAGNYYNIVNNIVHGVAVSDAGAGGNKTVSGNN